MHDIDNLLKEERFWTTTYENFLQKWSLTLDDMDVLSTMYNFERGKIINELLSGNFTWSYPSKVKLNKYGTSKKRIVYMFDLKERFILGVVYRVLSEYFKSEIDDTCFSYKKGVSTLTAIKYVRSDISIYNMYGVKLDISAYFNSVSSSHLQKCIKILFRGLENTIVYKLITDLYSISKVYDKGILIDEYMGLIPGTAVASFFANYCLKNLDKKMSRDNSVIYARYSDDIIVFAESEEKQKSILKNISYILTDYGLTINPRKFEYFSPNSDIDFLGLTFNKDDIDLHRHSIEKLKGKFKKDIRRGRKEVELKGKNWESVARRIIHKYNHLIYKCYLEDKSKYGWGYYAFRFATTDKSIREIDFYFKDRLRYLGTGHNNKQNINLISNEKLTTLGYVSMIEMYHLFRIDYDVYCDRVSLLK